MTYNILVINELTLVLMTIKSTSSPVVVRGVGTNPNISSPHFLNFFSLVAQFVNFEINLTVIQLVSLFVVINIQILSLNLGNK